MNEGELSPHDQTSAEFKRRRAEQLLQLTDKELEEEFNMRQAEIDAARLQGIIPQSVLDEARLDQMIQEIFAKRLPKEQQSELGQRRTRNRLMTAVRRFLQPKPTEK